MRMRIRIIITRHGETEENKKGLLQGHNEGTLSKRGIKQAEQLASRLQNEEIDLIFTSDLDRALKTTRIIAKHHPSTPVEVSPLLRERNFGDFQGRKREDVGWSLKDKDSCFPDPPNGESVGDVYKRAEEILNHIQAAYNGKTILVSAHGFIGKIIVGILQNKNMEDISAGASLRNTSLTIFDIREKEKIPVLIDSTDHLDQN